MENKKKIRIEDKYRALLTETLPLEKLFPFTNTSYHSIINNNRGGLPLMLQRMLKIKGYTIPFDYEALSKPGTSRKLSIVHPAKQIEIAEFYEKNKDYIVYLCNKSSVSLRRPASNYKYYYLTAPPDSEDEILPGEVDVAPEPFEPEDATYKSFFVYKPYAFLFKFYDSWKFLHTEKKFRFLDKLDISKCFYNIYTHTIEWSVKSKDYAKTTEKNESSFEKDFDRLMMESNYQETNGIVVGPEFSRIFAEIILQRIDENLIKKLSNKGVLNKEHYSILRYVDDYFIFTNDSKKRDLIVEVLKEELALIKLYLNDKKAESLERPFMTEESNAKIDISMAIDRFFKKIEIDGKYNKNSKPRTTTNYFIQELKKCVTSNGTSFSNISRYTLQIITKKAKGLIKNSTDSAESLREIYYYLTNVLFILYSYDSNYRTTSIICLFFLDVFNFFKKKSVSLASDFAKVFFEQSTNHIKSKIEKNEKIGIEELNLILVLAEICGYEKIEPETLSQWLDNSKKYNNGIVCYFSIVTALYYSSNKEEYRNIHNLYKNSISEYLTKSFRIKSSHDVILILDLMSCPWIEKDYKTSWAKIICEKIDPSMKLDKINMHSNKFVAFTSSRTWFMDWKAPNKLHTFLKKMEKRSPY